jgi:hypothetical protein
MDNQNLQLQTNVSETAFLVKMPPAYLQDQECRSFLYEILEGLKETSHG